MKIANQIKLLMNNYMATIPGIKSSYKKESSLTDEREFPKFSLPNLKGTPGIGNRTTGSMSNEAAAAKVNKDFDNESGIIH